jgi:hypothetical protein
MPQNDSFMILQKTPAAAVPQGGGAAVISADKNYTLEIIDCRLYVKCLELMDGLSLGWFFCKFTL